MKIKKYILFALVALLTASCHDNGNWDVVDPVVGMSSYGNQNLVASNPKTIAEVKALYASEIANGGLAQVTEYMQIQGIVVGNDEGGNIYQTLYIQDATGAIKISIEQSGLYGPFSVGQGVLIELKGLYVGGYGKLPQIGTIYENPKNGNIQTGRMSRYLWQQHYKLIDIPGLVPTPTVVTNMNQLDMDKDCGKLITLKGVEISVADGKEVYAPSGTGSTTVSRSIKGMSNVILYTSTFADFANSIMPTGKLDITGIASRYNSTWQIQIRTEDDVKSAQ
jgi:hypothetical protein